MEVCVICKQPLGTSPASTLGEKGSTTINQASEARNDTFHSAPGEKVHQECRRKYCRPREIAKAAKLAKQAVDCTGRRHVLRSAEKQFNFNTDCFFCGEPAKEGKSDVKTVEMKDTILAVCRERSDLWADTVKARLLNVHDLHAADAVYHRVCSVNFHTKKQVPAVHERTSKRAKVGRPQDKGRADAFLEVARYLEEDDDEQITINDLISHMEANSKHGAYSYPHMQVKLHEHFGDRIIQTEINGKPNVVTFRNKANTVLHEFYSHQKADPETEKMRIVQTAAKLIRDDIKAVETVYPACDELESDECINFLPETLKVLLEGLIEGKGVQTKIASVGQAIMQAARPRVLLAPLQVWALHLLVCVV